MLVSLDTDPIRSLEQLNDLISESFESYLSDQYTYLDLRVPDRLFACPSERKTPCEENLENMYGVNWQVDQLFPVTRNNSSDQSEEDLVK